MSDEYYAGCYGPKMNVPEAMAFLKELCRHDEERGDTGGVRFSTCLWGHRGCVLPDTEIEVRKVSDDGFHKIKVVEPQPSPSLSPDS